MELKKKKSVCKKKKRVCAYPHWRQINFSDGITKNRNEIDITEDILNMTVTETTFTSGGWLWLRVDKKYSEVKHE